MPGSDIEEKGKKAESSNGSVQIPNHLEDPASQQIYADPVRLKTISGIEYTYERETIEEHLKNHDTCPNTNEKVMSKQVEPDQATKNAVGHFLSENPQLWNTDVYMPKAWQRAVVEALKPLNRATINTYLTKHPGMLFAEYEEYENKTLIEIVFNQGAGEAFTWLTEKWNDRDNNHVINFINNYKQHHNGDKFFEAMILEENMSKSLLDAVFACHQYEGKQHGDTLLHFAVRTNNTLFARELVRHFGYDANQNNNNGQSAKEIAEANSNRSMINALKQKGKGKAKMSQGSTSENGFHEPTPQQALYPSATPSAPPQPASEPDHHVDLPQPQRPMIAAGTKPQLSDLHNLVWTLWQDPDANAPLAHAINWAEEPIQTSLLNRQKNNESDENSTNVHPASEGIDLRLPNGARLFANNRKRFYDHPLIYTTNERDDIKLMSDISGWLYWSQKQPNVLLVVKGSNIYFWNLNQQPTKSSSRVDETWQLNPKYQFTVHQIRPIALLPSKMVSHQCYIIAEDKRTLYFVDLRNNANNHPFVQHASAITSTVKLPGNHIAVGFGNQISIYDYNRNVIRNLTAKEANFKLDVDNQGQLKITYKNNDIDVFTFPYEPQPAILDTRNRFQNALVRVTQNDNCVSIDMPTPPAATSEQQENAFDELSRWYNVIISHYDTENWLECRYYIEPLVKGNQLWELKITAPSSAHAELLANLARAMVLPRHLSNQPHLTKVETEVNGSSSSNPRPDRHEIRDDMLPATNNQHIELSEALGLFTLARRSNLNIFHVLAKNVEKFLQCFTMQSFNYLLDADDNGIMPLHRLMAQMTVEQLKRLGAQFCREPRLINHFWAQKDHFGFTPIDCVLLFNPQPVEVLNALFHHLTTAMVYKTTQDRQFVQLPGLTWNDRSALVPIESAYGFKLHSRFRGANTWHDLLRFNSRLWKKTETASSSAFNRMFAKDPRDVESIRLAEMVNAHLAWVLWFQNEIKFASNSIVTLNQNLINDPAKYALNTRDEKIPKTHFKYVTKAFLSNKWTTDFPALSKPFKDIYNSKYEGKRYRDFCTETLNAFITSVLQSDQEESKKQAAFPDEGPSS